MDNQQVRKWLHTREPAKLLAFHKAQETLVASSQKNTLCIADIRSFLWAYLDLADCEKDGSRRLVCAGGIESFSQEECNRIINTVISAYLQEWGTNDQNLHQRLSRFVKTPFSHPADSDQQLEQNKDSDLLKRLHRAEAKYLPFTELRQLQLQEAFQNKNLKLTQEPVGKVYNLLSLSWIQQFHDDHLRYLDLIYHKKSYLNVTHQKEPFAALAEACKQYRFGLDRINALYTTDRDPRREGMTPVEIAQQLREYVSLCLTTAWLERACHFQLGSEIAAYLSKKEPDEVSFSKDYAQTLWAPVMFPMENLSPMADFCEEAAPEHCVIDTVLDILNYREQIPYAFGMHTSQSLHYIQKYRRMREKIMELGSYLAQFCPPSKQQLWRRKELQEIADFFYTDYPIITCYLELKYPPYEFPYEELQEGQERRRRKENANPFYRYLFQFYEYLLNQENSPVSIARDYLKEHK